MVPPLKDDENCTEMTGAVPMTTGEKATIVHQGESEISPIFPQVKFSHIQIYVDTLDDLEVYKALERNLCEFVDALKSLDKNSSIDRSGKRQLWNSTATDGNEKIQFEKFLPQHRDVIKQLMVGFGMRVTGAHSGYGTKSFLVTTKDLGGVQMVITAKDLIVEAPNSETETQKLQHFDSGTYRKLVT